MRPIQSSESLRGGKKGLKKGDNNRAFPENQNCYRKKREERTSRGNDVRVGGMCSRGFQVITSGERTGCGTRI